MLLEILFGLALLVLAHCEKHAVLMKLASDDYDKNIRPDYGQGPKVVQVTAHVQNAKWDKGEATFLMYLRQHWTDGRLDFSNSKNQDFSVRVYGPEVIKQMWKPDTFIVGTILTRAENEQTVRIISDGNVVWSQLVSATVPCRLPEISMDAKVMDLNIANCSIDLESYGFGAMDLDFQWKGGRDGVTVNSEITPKGLNDDGHSNSRRVALTSTGNYTRLEMAVSMEVRPSAQLQSCLYQCLDPRK